jgi:hypothetical protein
LRNDQAIFARRVGGRRRAEQRLMPAVILYGRRYKVVATAGVVITPALRSATLWHLPVFAAGTLPGVTDEESSAV